MLVALFSYVISLIASGSCFGNLDHQGSREALFSLKHITGKSSALGVSEVVACQLLDSIKCKLPGQNGASSVCFWGSDHL